MHILIFILLIISIFFLITLPKEKQKFWLIIALAIIVAFILLRFGRPYLSTIFGVIITLFAFSSRILGLISNYNFIRNFAKKYKNKSNISANEAASILEVSNNATKEEIKKAFKEKMKTHHPDKGGEKEYAHKLIMARDTLLKKIKHKS